MTPLQAIKEYRAEYGLHPNKFVLGRLLGVHPNTARNYIERLIADGQLRKKYREQEGHYEVV